MILGIPQPITGGQRLAGRGCAAGMDGRMGDLPDPAAQAQPLTHLW